jgi:hypothetical protein
MPQWIPCQCCGRTYPDDWKWYKCDTCGYRLCTQCIGEHQGQYGRGLKCDRCAFGQMRLIQGQGR